MTRDLWISLCSRRRADHETSRRNFATTRVALSAVNCDAVVRRISLLDQFYITIKRTCQKFAPRLRLSFIIPIDFSQ